MERMPGSGREMWLLEICLKPKCTGLVEPEKWAAEQRTKLVI
jgi:hypothetical protein